MPESRRERKVVTVLFADLVGFTARAEQLDPEDVEAILRPYHVRLRSELERFGGTVEKFIGDAVMALFGAPVAHEDDPERAVRAALAIRDWAREQDGAQVRIAVNTGEALINLGARPETGEGMAVGDVVNTTARLQSAAPVNGVLVGETTYRATRSVIDYDDADPVAAKGKAEPVPVWEAREARARVRTEPVSTSAPIVGRERELSLLRETLVRVREESSPQLLTLVGVPGIGKSRLVRELFELVEHGGVPTYWRQGRSLPYGEGVTFWALAEMVKAQAGILETDDDNAVEAKLREALANLVPDEAEAGRLAQHLRPLVGLSVDDNVVADSQAEAFAAWRQLFEAMAEQHPVVLVFEDLHWADDGLLDFVDHVVDWSARLPILIVCTARPELLERRPGWGGGKLNATTLSLSPLSDEDTTRLFAALLGSPVLESEQQQTLLARAGGNPLYAEQFAQMISEEADADVHVPENVQGIIAARLDRLPQPEKELLQDAAVLGKIFWRGGVVDGRTRDDVDQLLHSLERKGFVQRARRTSVSDEPEYAFLHLLVRDVAYGQIPRGDRAVKHQRAAEWIESLGRSEDHAEMLAHHYRNALEFVRAAGADAPELQSRAGATFRAAGDRAMALNAFATAASFYDEALALWKDDHSRDRAELLLTLGRALNGAGDARQFEILEAAKAALVSAGHADLAAEADALQAEALWLQGKRGRGLEYLKRAEELVRDRPSSASKARVLSEVARFQMVGGEYGDAIRTGQAAIAIAEELGMEEIRASALVTIGSARGFTGVSEGADDLETALEVADRMNFAHVAFRAINNLAVSLRHDRGEPERAAKIAQDGLRRAERVGDRVQITWFRGILTHDEFYLGRIDEALRLAQLVLEDIDATPHYQRHVAHQVRARIRLARDDVSGAAADVEPGLELARRIAEPQAVNPTFSAMAFVLLSLGQRDDAARLVEEVLANVRSDNGSRNAEPAFLTLSLVSVDLGRGAQFLEATENVEVVSPWLSAARTYAAGDLERAAELFAALSVPDAAWLRLRAAEQLVSQGRRAEADVQLQQALAFWRSVGATRYIREGEALLAATA
jgi:class 3 adenylate cyclase/tetratricopeptide (TPR) repeat protein